MDPVLDADPEKNPAPRFGSLRERVILSGGELFVEDNRSLGTTVRARWPR
jgi:signal transduction histidine kinase